MGRSFALALLLFGACKAQLGGDHLDDEYMDAATLPIDSAPFVYMDAPIDSGLGAWGTATKVPGADSTVAEDDCTLSSNKLELYFKRVDADSANLYYMTRASETSVWSTPALVPNINVQTTGNDEESPRLSSNDLTMYFGRSGEIYMTTRADLASPWQAPTLVTGLNTTAYEKWAAVCDDGYAIVSRAVTNRGQDLFAGTTAAATTALDNLNSISAEQGTFLSADCKHLYFQSNRDGTSDIFESQRPTITDAWSNPVKLGDFNTVTYGEEDAWISADQRTFVFASNASGNKDVYISTR